MRLDPKRTFLAADILLLAASCARRPDLEAISTEACRPVQDAQRSTAAWKPVDLGALVVRVPPGYAAVPWPGIRHSEGGTKFANAESSFVVANTYADYGTFARDKPVTMCEFVVNDMLVSLFFSRDGQHVYMSAWFHRDSPESIVQEPLLSMEYDARTVLRFRQVLWSARQGKGDAIASLGVGPPRAAAPDRDAR
jgi:hypothetical protein